MFEDHTIDTATARGFDPEPRGLDLQPHAPLRDLKTNARGVRHIDETAQGDIAIAIADHARRQTAPAHRSRLVASATRSLGEATSRRSASARVTPDGRKAA